MYYIFAHINKFILAKQRTKREIFYSVHVKSNSKLKSSGIYIPFFSDVAHIYICVIVSASVCVQMLTYLNINWPKYLPATLSQWQMLFLLRHAKLYATTNIQPYQGNQPLL